MFTKETITTLRSIGNQAASFATNTQKLIESQGETASRKQTLIRHIVTNNAAVLALMCAEAGFSRGETVQMLSLPEVLGAGAVLESSGLPTEAEIQQMIAELDNIDGIEGLR